MICPFDYFEVLPLKGIYFAEKRLFKEYSKEAERRFTCLFSFGACEAIPINTG